MTEHVDSAVPEARETGRLEAFSDGVRYCHHATGTRTEGPRRRGRRDLTEGSCGLVASVAELRWTGDELFYGANHVGASPCDSSQRVQDRRVAAFCERLAAALCDVCSLPHFDFGGVPADECGKNGGGVLLGDFRVDRSEFLSVYPSSVPEAAAFIGRVARICGKDASRLHVRSPDVPDGDGFGVFKRPLVPGHLHAVVDFLGDDDHEEYAGLKATCRYVSTSVVGRDELTVLDVHVADIRRQAKFVAVFG